ncbi:16S rRNA processing protein RimM [bacterium]|nr:MAG: 16S rRNA processing protein RimM [bacterium]
MPAPRAKSRSTSSTSRRSTTRTAKATRTRARTARDSAGGVGGELVAGRIVGLFGIHGELKLQLLLGERPAFSAGERVRLRMPGGAALDVTARSLRPHAGRWLVAFDDAADPTAAQRYVGASVLAYAGELPPLGAGEYYDHQLVGCEVVDVAAAGAARLLGPVERVEHWPASDILILRGGAMVPLVHAYEPVIDLDARRITLSLPVGLIDASAGERA